MATTTATRSIDANELAAVCGGADKDSFGRKVVHVAGTAAAAGIGGMVSWALGTGAGVTVGVATHALPRHAGDHWGTAGKVLVYGSGLASGLTGAWYAGKAAWNAG